MRIVFSPVQKPPPKQYGNTPAVLPPSLQSVRASGHVKIYKPIFAVEDFPLFFSGPIAASQRFLRS